MSKRFAQWSLLFFWLLFIMGCQRSSAPQPQADLILKNGVFFTADPKQPEVEAVAILGDRILAVGGEEDLAIYKKSGTRVMDLGGRFACPGFNDSHVQDLVGYQHTVDVNLFGVTTLREMQDRINAALRKHPKPMDVWLVGRGWDQSIMTDLDGWPNKKHLQSRIWTDRPMVFYRICGHAALVNWKALRIAQISKNTPSPPGGEIEKNPRTGEPTGILKDAAMDLLDSYMPAPDVRLLGNGVRRMLHMAARFGVTSIQGQGCEPLFHIFKAFKNSDSLTCRINYWGKLTDGPDKVARLRGKSNDNMLHAGALSASLDGSMGTYGAALLWPYIDRPTLMGLPKLTQSQLNDAVLKADKAGMQVAVHAIGDAAGRLATESYELLSKLAKGEPRRLRLEHAQLLTDEDIQRLGALGVVASMQPAHLLDDLRWVQARLGQARCANAYAWRKIKTAGMTLAFGTYWPVTSMNPMHGLYAAVTRRDTLGFPLTGWYPQQRLTIEEAIEAYTLGSAYAEKMEDEKGSLTPGKLADIVVLDQNLLKISPRKILDTRVVWTFLGGKLVYQGAAPPQ